MEVLVAAPRVLISSRKAALRLPDLALPGFPFLNRRHRRPSSYYHLSFHRITLPAIFFFSLNSFFLSIFFSPLPFFILSLSPFFFFSFFISIFFSVALFLPEYFVPTH